MATKVLVIGIDAMDPRIARALMSCGKLPNFQKLYFQELQTTTPPETPVAWSAAATGANPGRYGIFDFLKRDTKTYLPKLNLAEEKPGLVKTTYTCAMKGVPFWRTLSEAEVPVTVLRWPVTFPPEKINGNMLSGLGVVDLRGSLNSYSFFTSDREYLKLEGQEKVSLVEPGQEEFEVELAGPMVRKRGELRKITVPMKIRLQDGRAHIEVGSNSFALSPGEWSAVVSTKFRVLPFLDMHGSFNVYLKSLSPNFSLYVSSVQIDPENQAVEITNPAGYGKELVSAVGAFYTLGMAEDTKAVTEGKLPLEAFFQQVQQIEAERERMFWYEFGRFREGVLAVVFDAGDRLNHIFWENHDDILSVADDEIHVPQEIEWYYTAKDAMLGQVLEQIDEDTKLIALSDHGFSDFKRQVNLNAWLVREGYMKVSGQGDDKLFGQVDWSETSAYSLGFTSLFLNLEGREAQGIVPPEDRDAVLEEISSKLLRLKDQKMPVVTGVHRGDKIYSGKAASEAPDLILGFAPGYRMSWKSAVGACEEDVFLDNESEWKGDHLIDRSHVPGVLFTNFETNREGASLIDIAPTILSLADLPPGEEIDGETLV